MDKIGFSILRSASVKSFVMKRVYSFYNVSKDKSFRKRIFVLVDVMVYNVEFLVNFEKDKKEKEFRIFEFI